MKNIIVPIDFSEESLNGLDLAIVFANKHKCNIQMVYVIKHPYEIGKLNTEDEKKVATRAFEELLKEYSPQMHDASKLEYIIKKGKIYKEIVHQAQAFEKSIIITSTHGASGFEELFIGSNALKIISSSDIPVITVRKELKSTDINNIVLPIDTTKETRQKVPLTIEIAKAFNAKIHVLAYTYTGIEEAEEKVSAYSKQACDFIKEHGVEFTLEHKSGSSMVKTTIDFAEKVNANLISIMTEQDDSLADLLLGTNAQQMLNKSPIPVLSVTPKDFFYKESFKTFGSGN